ncbi:DUF4845 domain-containing protein [Nitrosomonas aestuarii]|uniref:DUF4845 domain-containing protein n=1 Tax=Nitrosomonas aestuarii TaxID=52441 RepID=UPI000D3024ED|nr:DUF4845 domain-containing protein [Nitrosomonas aestuarii]PTN12648.1 uncharacterized protein DUF4845 [Nitrosomonas aestuarii]
MDLYGYRYKQLGLSLSGLLMWSVVLVLFALLGMKVAPVYIENAAIKQNLVAIANDSSLQNVHHSQLRLAFSKRAQIDNITSVTAKDINITRNRNRNEVVLSVDYSAKIPLAANISLLIDFNTQSN